MVMSASSPLWSRRKYLKTTAGWTDVKFCAGVRAPQRMNPTDSRDLVTFFLSTTSRKKNFLFSFPAQYLYWMDYHKVFERFPGSQRMNPTDSGDPPEYVGNMLHLEASPGYIFSDMLWQRCADVLVWFRQEKMMCWLKIPVLVDTNTAEDVATFYIVFCRN